MNDKSIVNKIKILFEDNDIIVCIKPIGVLSQADSSGKSNMISILSESLKCSVFPIHRLDRDVGGIMVFAKTSTAAAALNKAVLNHNFSKEYIAFVHSKPEVLQGEMRDLLFRDSKRNKSYVVNRERKGVREALLEYKLLDTFKIDGEICSEIKILLHTGRTHQIRVQFASRKMPLLGDKKYGANDKFDKIGLWSYKLIFLHPKTKAELSFSSPPEFSMNKTPE